MLKIMFMIACLVWVQSSNAVNAILNKTDYNCSVALLVKYTHGEDIKRKTLNITIAANSYITEQKMYLSIKEFIKKKNNIKRNYEQEDGFLVVQSEVINILSVEHAQNQTKSGKFKIYYFEETLIIKNKPSSQSISAKLMPSKSFWLC